MAGTPRTNRSTAPNAFYSGGRDSSRMDRRMDARFEALEKDYASLNERMLSLTQRIDFLKTDFQEFKSSTSDFVSNKMSELEKRINELDYLLMERNEQLPEGTKPAKKRRKIPNELSAKVKLLYDAAPNDKHFNPAEPYASETNTLVKEYLMQHMKERFQDQYSPKRLKATVHRYYESRRRLFNDSQPSRVNQVEKVKLETKKRQQRRKLYVDRMKVLKKAKERDLWQSIDYRFMTDESEGEDDKGEFILRHSLPWRSKKLDKLVTKLNKRIPRSKKSKEVRQSDVSSLIPPPLDAPSWAINSNARCPQEKRYVERLEIEVAPYDVEEPCVEKSCNVEVSDDDIDSSTESTSESSSLESSDQNDDDDDDDDDIHSQIMPRTTVHAKSIKEIVGSTPSRRVMDSNSSGSRVTGLSSSGSRSRSSKDKRSGFRQTAAGVNKTSTIISKDNAAQLFRKRDVSQSTKGSNSCYRQLLDSYGELDEYDED